jgi:hypothetical protein
VWLYIQLGSFGLVSVRVGRLDVEYLNKEGVDVSAIPLDPVLGCITRKYQDHVQVVSVQGVWKMIVELV